MADSDDGSRHIIQSRCPTKLVCLQERAPRTEGPSFEMTAVPVGGAVFEHIHYHIVPFLL